MSPASRVRRQPAGKKPVPGRSRSQKSGRRFRWPLTWVGSLISAAVLAAVTAAVTVIVTQLTQSAVHEDKPQAVRPGPPVLFDSVQNLHKANDYAFPAGTFEHGQLADLNRQLSIGDYGSWMTSHGGVGVGLSMVQLVVSGNARGGARITNITLAKNCQQPLRGTLFSTSPQGGQASLPLGFNLDQPTPNARTPSGQDYFSMNTIELKPSEQQVIDVAATTDRFFCSYQLRLTVLANGKSITEPVPADSDGFKVTAYADHYSSIYRQGTESEVDGDFYPVNPKTWVKPEAGDHG